MRLPNDALIRAFVVIGTSASLGACSILPSGKSGLVGADYPATAAELAGPRGDFPVVLGDPFVVDGQEFVPNDSMNYDAVGFAVSDREGGQGITVAHKTLPLPSYVEVTELTGGRTILARVERRGPMAANQLIALSPGAMGLLGVDERAPVRVRRVNPPETDRSELRAGRKASDRMDTPASLLTVLKRKLGTSPAPVVVARTPEPASNAAPAATPVSAERNPRATDQAGRSANTSYPLRSAGLPVTRQASTPAASAQAVTAEPTTSGGFVVQAAAFSSKANADRAALKIGGFVTQAGNLYRVRTGPYASRGQAEAALAKVREAGYSDARVFTSG